MEVRNTNVRNVYFLIEDNKKILATKNMTPGRRYYTERLFKTGVGELREWIPYKSKLAAAYLKGLDIGFMNRVRRILYLGMATGTTVSHISDILADMGVIFGVEVAPRVMLEFLNRVAPYRDNIIPLFFDARKPDQYIDLIGGKVDLVYCDVAQPDQTKIAIDNSRALLNKNGILLLAVKARSIDAVKDPIEIYRGEEEKLGRSGFKVIKSIILDPYEKDHSMIYATYEP